MPAEIIPGYRKHLRRGVALSQADRRSIVPQLTNVSIVDKLETQGAPVAQWIERLTSDQKVGGSTPSGRAMLYLMRFLSGVI